jgi:general secretion pathway protein C
MLEIPDLRGWFAKSVHGPLLVSLVLGALIVVEVARASLSLLATSPTQSSGTAKTSRSAPRRPPGANVDVIVAAHLFGIAENGRNQDPARALPTTANLLLAGTIATSDPKHGFAIISGDSLSKVYSVGDAVGGASLHSVYLDHIILDRGGNLEKLALPRPRLATARPPDQAVKARPGAVANNSFPPGESGRHNLAEVMRVGSSEERDGKLHGFHIYPVKNRLAFSQLGLERGDLVVAVNGASVEDQNRETGQAVFDTVRTSSMATLTVERAGQREDVTIDVAQADISLSND